MINRIKQYRLAAGLTPQMVASLFKIPYGTVLKWEKEEAVPPLWAEEKIVNALKEKVKSDQAKARARFRFPTGLSGKTPEEIAAANAARRWHNPTRREYPPVSQEAKETAEEKISLSLPPAPSSPAATPSPRTMDGKERLAAAKMAAMEYEG